MSRMQPPSASAAFLHLTGISHSMLKRVLGLKFRTVSLPTRRGATLCDDLIAVGFEPNENAQANPMMGSRLAVRGQ